MKTAIVFGATGQDGSHLIDLLLEKNYKVIGAMRRSSTNTTYRLKHCLNHPNLQLVEADITDNSSVLNVLRSNTEHVDEIYNLAAQSHVGTSFKQPGLTWDITGKGCINILQAIVDLEMFGSRFYQASSSEMFGSSYSVGKDGVKYQDENTRFLPQSPYAISKCAAHYAVRLFREAYHLHASSGILFNHEGPRRGDNFVTQKIIKWLVSFIQWRNINYKLSNTINFSENYIILNNQEFPKLRLGNIKTFRDWGYAGDYVKAMWMMLQQETPDDYVICTGKTSTVEEFLNIAFNYVGLSDWQNYIVIDPELYRPAEVEYLLGNCDKAQQKLGWKPEHDLDKLVELMIETRLNEKL